MQSTTLAQPRQYGAAQARFIMKLADECAGGFNFLEFRDTAEVPGVFMSEPYADVFPSGARGIEAGRLLAWNPAIDLENGPDPATWPLLPAEFTARDLAAFLLYGVGTFIHDALGPYGVLDEAALENVGGSRDEWARQALREAYELAGRAQAVVGPLDDEAERKAHMIGEQLDKENGQANERERVFEPGIPADEANARRDRAKASVARLEKEFEELTAEATQKRERWRKAMMRALFEVEDAHEGEPASPAPAKPAAKRLRDFVQDAVDRICAHESPDGTHVDRRSMPGTALDLLWAMEKLHPDKFGEMKMKAFREHYKGICQWPNSARSQAGAKSLYLAIFPELRHNPALVVQIRK